MLDHPLAYLAVIGIFLVTGLAIWLVMLVVFGVIVPKWRASRSVSTASNT